MKTLTEFAAITLKNAIAKKQELVAAGKTAEELPAAMGEALKLEGDKLTYLLGALETTNDALGRDFKRILVSSLNEGETAPSSAKLVGEKYYTIESYPASMKTTPAPAQEERGRGGKGGGRGGKDDKRGGGRPGGPGGDRGGAGGAGGGRGPRTPSGPQSASSGGLPKPLATPNKA